MDSDRNSAESFEEFKDSFSYGSRNDLSFKFIKRLSEPDAAEFIRQVFDEIGEMFDDASSDRLLDVAYEWQVRAYTPAEGATRPYVNDDRPFAPLAKPLAETTVGLLSSSGHYVGENDPNPFGLSEMSQEQAIDRIDDFLRAAPMLSEIPNDVDDGALRVRHPGYDIRSASRDAAVALPRDLLLDAERERRIGHFASVAFSFVGACAQGRLRKELDGWFERWDAQGIEALFLVPVWPQCHVSVGHVAREAEKRGIPTVAVVVRSFAHVAREMVYPRTVVTRHPMGRPMGPPGGVTTQRRVVAAALDLLEGATGGGTVVELEDPYRPEGWRKEIYATASS